MKGKRILSIVLAVALMCSCWVGMSAAASTDETTIKLSDFGVKVNGQEVATDASAAVYTGADIVYYKADQDSSYGEGTAADEHSEAEAAGHTVVTITQPGTYRVSGKLSAGQLAIDLGDDAASDPNAKVTLILDGVDITSTVAPAVIFYNVYEPYSASEDTKGVVNLTNAGAQVILADNSVNTVKGSYVARIYKEGTTKKLHKYDGAFYSKMSMNISGEAEGTGELHIKAANEGLDSELHLAINGGKIYIESQDDGINTNEDGISVTTINGGYLYVNAGLGAEGDGIDSNGYLTINGGTIVAMSNERSPDGGIDADGDITINGGTVIALGTRNDAVASSSKQQFMELSFASTQLAGSVIKLTDAADNELFVHTAEKPFQSLTFSSKDLALNTEYHLYINGVQQQYTGNASGMMGGGGFGGNRPPMGDMNEQPSGGFPATGEFTPPQGTERPERPDGERPELPDGFITNNEGNGASWGNGSNGTGDINEAAGAGSISFMLTNNVSSFSGISDSSDASGKIKVTFNVNNGKGLQSTAGQSVILDSIVANADVSDTDIQLTITDIPSEDYAETYLLSEVKNSLANILPEEEGQYRLTIAVVASNETYTGASQYVFNIGGLPFADLNPNASSYAAIKALYEKGIMVGTDATSFSPNESVTRAMAITTLGRLLNIEQAETSQFSDVAANSWYSGYVGWAAANGIVEGDGNGHYMPNEALTKAQLAFILSRYAELSGTAIESTIASSNGEQYVTRAELAVILKDLL